MKAMKVMKAKKVDGSAATKAPTPSAAKSPSSVVTPPPRKAILIKKHNNNHDDDGNDNHNNRVALHAGDGGVMLFVGMLYLDGVLFTIVINGG